MRTGHSDDFASLAEAIIRRFGLNERQGRIEEGENGSYNSSIPSSPLPDVVLIDGGRGQVDELEEVLQLLMSR